MDFIAFGLSERVLRAFGWWLVEGSSKHYIAYVFYIFSVLVVVPSKSSKIFRNFNNNLQLFQCFS